MSQFEVNALDQRTIDASGETVVIDCAGFGSLGLDVRGTFTATLVPEGTINNSNWVTLDANPVGGGAAVNSITAAGAWTINCAGLAQVRVRCSAYTSGTMTVRMLASVDAGVNNNIEVSLAETDIEIGAVELKDAATDSRASIEAANTARTTATKVIAVQHVDALGNVLPASPILGAGTAAIGKLAANSGVDIGDVDVTTVGTITPGTGATNLGKAEDAAHASGDVGIFSLGVANEAQSTLAADGDYIAQATDTKGNRLVTGNVAHDGVDAGAPIKTGGQARTTNPTAVADADRVNFIADKLGKQVVVGSIRDLKGQQKTTITSSTAETTIVTAVASTFLDLYGLIISNTSATACNVTIKDSTAGTTRAIIAVPAGDVRGFMLTESAAIPQATVNNNWTATCSASVASIEITALYVKNI